MKILFFGTSKFAVTVLKRLSQTDLFIAAVITQPDRKSGRNLKITGGPIKREADKLKLAVFQQKDLGKQSFVEKLKRFDADFFVVAAFGQILPKKILGIPRFCCLNIHASLLPKYRGAAPISYALLNGDKKTGVTVIRMNEKMDAGDIAACRELRIGPADNRETLGRKLAILGAELLIDAFEPIASGRGRFVKQNDKIATFAPRLTKSQGRIDWNISAANIINLVRGLAPWPGTYTFLNKRLLKIISAKKVDDKPYCQFEPGAVVSADDKSGLIIKTGDGALLISELQLEGKKPMSANSFLRGHKINIGIKLG